MDMDYKAAAFYLDVLQWLSIGLIAVWGYIRSKDSDNNRAISKVANELADFIESSRAANEDQNNRLTMLQEKVSHLPTEQDVAHLSNDMSSVKAQINGMASLLSRVEHQTNLIHDHLLNKPR
jgi:N-glycosylase/DNA lyase